jgi:hypothetical protein
MSLRLVFALFFGTITAFAQPPEPGEVRGRVVSSRDGQPLGLVQVVLRDTSFRAVTGDDGTFRIPGVPAGKYTLQTSVVGYQLNRQEFTLGTGEGKSFDVVLTSSTAQRTDTVEVSAGAFEGPTQASAAAITLEGDERKNLASVLTDDPLRAVQSLPGVTTSDDFSSAFSLRGAPFDRIGLYLDGILLHSPFHTTDGVADDGSVTIFNGDLTDALTLYQGAWPVRYGDRTAGILAVESRDGDRQEIQGKFSASSSNASLLLEGPLGKNKRGSWLVAFRKSYLQYILNQIDFGNQAPYSFGFTDGEARLTYDLTPRHTVSLSDVEGASSVDRTPYQSELAVNSVMLSSFRYSLINLGSRYAPNDRVAIANHLAWTRERGDVNNRDLAPLSSDAYGEWTWRGDATVLWGGKNSFDFGGQFRQLRDDGLAQRFIYTPVLTAALDPFRGNGHQAGAYVQQAFVAASGKVRFTVGVREDGHSDSVVNVTSPYVGASFQPLAKTSVQLNWGQYSQFPELNQFFSTFATSRLLPERATHYEATIEQTLDDRTRLRLEFYDRQDRDILASPLLDPRILLSGTLFNAVANAPLTNSEKGYSRGVQIFLQRRTANGFTGWISYAYGRNIVTDGVLGLSFPSDYDQRHTFNAYVSRRLSPTVNLSLRVTYGSGMPLPGFYEVQGTGYVLSANRNGLRLPAYLRTDLRMNKAWTHEKTKTTLFAEIVNITDHTNRDFDTPGPYSTTTQQVFPNFYTNLPILPSAGMVFEF